MATLNDIMKIEVTAHKSTSEVWILHDTPFESLPIGLEYDTDSKTLMFYFLDGSVADMGITFSPNMEKHLKTIDRATLMLVQDKDIKDAMIVKLTQRSYD